MRGQLGTERDAGAMGDMGQVGPSPLPWARLPQNLETQQCWGTIQACWDLLPG